MNIPPVLTSRERLVVQLYADGLIQKEIACRLDISSQTVRQRVYRAMERLNVRTIPALTARAVTLGIIEPVSAETV